MATDIATLSIKVSSGEVVTADVRLAHLTATGNKTEAMTVALQRAVAGIGTNSGGITTADRRLAGMAASGGKADAALVALRRTVGGIGLAFLVRETLSMADAATNMASRLGLVTTSAAKMVATQEALFQISQRSRADLEATVTLYTRFARNANALGASQTDLLRVTETISKAMIISGASAETSRAALVQLGQAMASGTLRGDELNSVLENAPRLAEAIATGMGVTVGKLRQLGQEGKLTSKDVFDALKSQGAAIDEQFAKMPITVGGAMTQVRNATVRAIGEFDKMTGSSRAVAEGISGIASAITELTAHKEDIVAVGLAVGGVATAIYTAQKAAALLTAVQASRWFFALEAVAGGAATAVEGLALALGSTATAGAGLGAVLAGVVAAPLVGIAALATAGALAIYVLKKAIDDQDAAAEEATKNTKAYVDYLKALGRAHAHAPGKDDTAPTPPPVPFSTEVTGELSRRDQEIAKQRALNEAFGASSVALAHLNNAYDARADRARNAIGHTAAETAALNARTESMRKARDVAIDLAAAEEQRNRRRAGKDETDDAVKAAQDALELSRLSEDAAKQRRVDLDAENDLRKAWRDYQTEIAKLDAKSDADQIRTAKELYDLAVKRIEVTRTAGHATVANTEARDQGKKDAEEAKRQLEKEVRTVSRQAGNIVYEALDAIGHRRNPFQAWLDAAKNGINRILANIAGDWVGSLYEKIRGKGPEAAATKNAAAAAAFNVAADKILAGAQIIAGAKPTAVPTQPGTSNTTQPAPSMDPRLTRALGFAGAALGGFQTGNAVGASLYSTSHGTVGNYARGALGGAASGALAGAAIGSVVPGVGTVVGAVVGGAAGLVGGLLGISSASKEAKRNLAELQKSLSEDMASLRASVTGDALAAGKADIERDREQRRKAIEEAYQGGGANSDTVRKRNALLKEMNALEDESLKQLERRVALEQGRQKEDFQAREAAATPGNEEAEARADFIRGQQREREDLVTSFGSEIDAEEQSRLDALDRAQAAELKSAEAAGRFADAVDAAALSVRNAPAGFWGEQYTREFSVRRPTTPSQLAAASTQPKDARPSIPISPAAAMPVDARPSIPVPPASTPPPDTRPAIPNRPVAVFPNATINVKAPDSADPVEFAKLMLEGVRRLTDLTGINMSFTDLAAGAGI